MIRGLFKLSLVGLLVCSGVPARGALSTAFYLTASSYTGQEGGGITVTVGRELVNGSFNNWNLGAAATVTVSLAPSGTYQINSADVPGAWQWSEVITIDAFEYVKTFTIPFNQNTDLQYDRTATLSVNNVGAVNASGYASANVSLLDDDNSVYALIHYAGTDYCDDLEIYEGATGGYNTATLRILMDGGAVQGRTVNFTIGSSTATTGSDYASSPSLSGSVTIPAGIFQTNFTITVLPDALQEGNETVVLQLTSGVYTIASGCGTRTVTLRDDTPRVRVYATSPVIAEGGSTVLVFERTNGYSISAACTNKYTVSGTASNGSDYGPSLSGTAIIPAGTLYTTVALTATNDLLLEGAETVTVTLSNGLYSIIPGYEATTVTIHDDYPTITIRAADDYAQEVGDTGTFTLERTGNYSQAVTVQLNISGSATPANDYTALPTSITFAAGAWTTNLVVTPLADGDVEGAETVVVSLQTNAAYVLGLETNAVVTIASEEANPRDTYTKAERYMRGSGTNVGYYSTVIPLDGLRGTRRLDIDSSSSNSIVYHYNATNTGNQAYVSNRIAFNTPIVSFGGTWGTPLYIGQSYSLGMYVGQPVNAPIYIHVFRRSDGGPEGTISLSMPDLNSANDWTSFATNGFARSATNYGLTTTVRISDSMDWGSGITSFVLTHTADATATNYNYMVTAAGALSGMFAVLTNDNQPTYGYFYDLTFEQRPGWRSIFVDQPHFQGEPLPPHLWNKTPDELLYYGAAVTNAVALTPLACTNLDHSPELRRHPVLDQFVSDFNNDPIALANYVQNEIDLTDPIAYRDDGSVSTESVNPGGVNRGALGVYMEGQGSATEQCALLVYLLRQAGYPATYVFPPEGGLKMLDKRLSTLLRMRINGAQDDAGRFYTTNQLIAVNYPWVAAYVGNQWVHLFPWIKDTAVEEGLDIYDYLPASHKQMQLWVRDYVYGKTNITAFATPTDDTPGTIFPRWLDSALKQNAPGISLDDLGMRYINRRHLYSQWSDFPRPTWTTNTSTAVESLTATSITNVSSRLTNIFDAVQVELFSVNNPQKRIATADMRMVDLHNRRFYLSHTNVSAGQVQAILSLSAYRPASTGQGTFSPSDTTLTNKQVLTLTLDGTDDDLRLRLRHRRQKALSWETALDSGRSFLDLNAVREVLQERPVRKGDVAAICINAGRVTPAMLRVHAQELWNMEQMLSTNSSLVSQVSPDIYHGSLLYLAGMSYYERVDRNDSRFQDLFKARVLSRFAMGLSKLSPRRNPDGTLYSGALDPIWPNVDMFFWETAAVGNGTARLDSGWDGLVAKRNYFNLLVADASAQEHATLNTFFGQSSSISTVKLLQQAQAKVPAGGSNIVELSVYTADAAGNVLYNGTALKNHNLSMWNQVVDEFLAASPHFVVAWMTPGTQTTPSGSFSGMGVLFVGNDRYAALIGNNQYGGYADALAYGSTSAGNTPWYEIRQDADGNYTATFSSPGANDRLPGSEVTTVFDILSDYYQHADNAYVPNPNQNLAGVLNNLITSGAYGTYLDSVQRSTDLGVLGSRTDYRGGNGLIAHVGDPVNALTGEFYVDEVDLSLPGPMPLQLRRNYGSQNLAPNQLGFGWKLNYMPYLSLAASNVIYVAEADGSVLAFGPIETNVWSPSLALNPTLNNNSIDGIGSLANRLNAKLTKISTNYFLTGGDGSLRVFQEMSFPLTNSASWDRFRPYLTFWYDNRSNFYRFEYGTNTVAGDYGQVRRVVSSSGNILRFQYDVYGRIVDVFSLDGRRVQYGYDNHGDLATVTRPDTSEINYEYQVLTWSTNSVTNIYSTHLLTKELKPDGRVLKNEYDDQRRVTNQWSTVGADLNLVRNATFRYTNNFILTNLTATLNGTTTILDYTNNPTTYYYTNGLIRRISYPLGADLVQTWYEVDETNSPAYPRSLKTITDKRGLLTTLYYDHSGNITNTTSQGDLLGDGNTNTTAATLTAYNTNNLPVRTVDSSGTTNLFFYTNTWLLARLEVWPSNATSAQAITNLYSYAHVTNAVDGTFANGLRVQQIRAAFSLDASTNEWVYESRGFPIKHTQYTGTGDPALVISNFFNYRGELVRLVDAVGRETHYGFDPLGRPQSREVYEAGQSVPIAWDSAYYNENGELTWTDGPRFNPEDYVWRDYDGAGRQTQEVRWRSQAKQDGTGVEAALGDDLFAATFLEYDAFDNLTKVSDPRGNFSRKQYDALGRLLREEFYDSSGTLLATNGFVYNAAGDVTNAFNAIGGSAQALYTSTGQPRFQRNANGSTNAWLYYADGRLRREIQNNGAYRQTTYDDANRKATQVFYSAGGSPLSTNIAEFDRRGNLVKRTDAGGFVFTNLFDGLGRLKVAAGPPIVTVKEECPFVPGCGIWVTNVLQQRVTSFYDAAGVWQTNVNALGEKAISRFDALGRSTRSETHTTNNTMVRESHIAYSANHHSVTVTNGSGATALVTTAFTDTAGQTVLGVAYPYANVREFTRNEFDSVGNPIFSGRYAVTNAGFPLFFSGSISEYDGLNRVSSMLDRDNALTTFAYNAAGNLTNRTMPGGLQWNAIYNNAGQLLKEWNSGAGGTHTSTNTYAYYASGTTFAGLLQTSTEGRGITCTHLYDPWLRPATNSYSPGPMSSTLVPITVAHLYDRRGLLTNLIETVSSSPTSVRRSYDAYGQLVSENVSGLFTAGPAATQTWDAAGRRTGLSYGTFSYNHGWRADNLLESVAASVGGGSYSYNTAGVLTNRTVANRTTSLSSFDGVGRPLSIITKLSGLTKLTETLSYTGDGLLSTHTLDRAGDFVDSRSYFYADYTRRLTEERLNLDATKRWTNWFTFDAGATSGPGALTKVAATSATQWSGGTDAFSRINTETNTVRKHAAYGRVNGTTATVTASLDGNPVAVTLADGPSSSWPKQWRSLLALPPGNHQLTVSAAHRSGQFTTNVSVWFTNNAAHERVTDFFDAAGNITQRIWKSPDGTTNRTQTLTWNVRGRLQYLFDLDSQNNGYLWETIYDGFGRRWSTYYMGITNGNYILTQFQTTEHYYDPEVEFLDVGVKAGSQTTWKVYGPDVNGAYGGMQGMGGLEGVAPGLGQFYLTIGDARGNILGAVTNGLITTWTAARPTGYGAVPGYQPLPLGHGGDIVTASAWRGMWGDVTGFYWRGKRYYDPVAGQWLSHDPVWNGRDPNYYSFCGGDPINYFDPDGRFGRNSNPYNSYINGIPSTGDHFSPNLRRIIENALAGYPSSYVDTSFGGRLANFSSGLGMFGLGFVPVVNDLMEVYTIGAPDSSAFDRSMSGLSLAANTFTGGVAPNYAPIMGGLRRMARAFDRAPTPHAPHIPTGPPHTPSTPVAPPSPTPVTPPSTPHTPPSTPDAPGTPHYTPNSYPNPDPPMNVPPVRYEPNAIQEVERMRDGLGPTTKATHGTQNIEAHHRQQIPIENGGVMDELTQQTHRGRGNHSRHSNPSQLTPQQRAREIEEHWRRRGSEYVLPGEGI